MWSFIWTVSIPFYPPKMWLVSSLVQIGHVNLEKINVYCRQCILPNYHLLQNGMALDLNNCEFPLFKDAFCQVWFKLAHWFFKCLQCIFANTLLSPSGMTLCLNNLETFSEECFVSRFGWNNLIEIWRKQNCKTISLTIENEIIDQ